MREVREPHTSPVLLSVFSLVPDLLLDCLRILEYAKIRTVLQSMREDTRMDTIIFKEYTNFQSSILELSHFKFVCAIEIQRAEKVIL